MPGLSTCVELIESPGLTASGPPANSIHGGGELLSSPAAICVGVRRPSIRTTPA
jgi:hypothetical protein